MKATLALLVLAAAGGDGQERPPSTAELYKTHCQSCHMVDGNSPLEPLNFVDGTWKHGSSPARVALVIADGVPGTAMLSFGDKLTPGQVRALAAHVRAFDKRLKPPAKPSPKKK